MDRQCGQRIENIPANLLVRELRIGLRRGRGACMISNGRRRIIRLDSTSPGVDGAARFLRGLHLLRCPHIGFRYPDLLFRAGNLALVSLC